MSEATADAKRLHEADFTARHFLVHPNTIENWLSRGYIRAFRLNGTGPLLFDLDEIERAFKVYGPSKMRDGRKRGAKGRVVAVVVAEGGDQ
ncbi:hypothetical protein F6W69_06045 [Microbacterium oxydans]|uniref:hypothetical protein n=1 Tax=Microbacterium oxydans TaxID=82380 RepID=UPI001144673F|nr:hypothetical protein [Microbacterium oxydans]KAB1893585.1 hypothetical protein F6W69_06045 [Microbacterium oxydans]GED38084.1 hypothetical protein MOX01_12260 [Microbacterium oxydans]